MADASTYQRDATLNEIRNGTPFVGLFTTMPADGGGSGVEVSAASYARKAITFAAPADASPGRKIVQSALVTFDQAAESWGTAVGLGIWDAAAGNLRAFHAFTGDATFAIGAGQQFTLPSGSAVITVI
jgi:hypothetical protein